MAYQLQLRNDTTDHWLEANPVLAKGEMVIITDREMYVIGDGVSRFSDLRQMPFGLDAYEVLKRNGYKGTLEDFCRQLDSSLRLPEQQAGTLTNAGPGWNSFTFPKEFVEECYVVLTPQEAAVFASCKNITKQGFHYCLYDKDGNTTSEPVVVNFMATAVSELNMAQAIAKAAGLNPFSFDNLTDLFETNANEVVGSPEAFDMVKRSAMASGRYICHLTGLNPVSYFNMVSIAGDESAMNTVSNSPETVSYIQESPGAYDSIRRGTMPMAKYLCGILSSAPESYTTVTMVLDNGEILTLLVASQPAMEALCGSKIASTEMAAHPAAAIAVAASSVAMDAVADNSIAYMAIYESAVGYPILLASELAMATIAESQEAITALIQDAERCAGLAASETAMTAVAASETARYSIQSDEEAYAVVLSTDGFISRWAAACAGLLPEEYPSMSVLTENEEAMTAVAASSVAMTAVAASSVARDSIQTEASAYEVVLASDEFTARFAIGELDSETYLPESFASVQSIINNSGALSAVSASSTAMGVLAASSTALNAIAKNKAAKDAVIAQNSILQQYRLTIRDTIRNGSTHFSLFRAQRDDDEVSGANIVGEKYVVLAIPGSYGSSSSSKLTTMFHGHNGAQIIQRYGSYTDESQIYIGLGGATFTEQGDGEVRTLVYEAK